MKVKKAFTLIELLVVIAVIALLISVLIPALKKAKDTAKSLTCSSNQRQIGLAVKLYAEDNDGFFPRGEQIINGVDFIWLEMLMYYIEGVSDASEYWNVKVYNCPAYPIKEQTVDYINNAWSATTGTQMSRPTRMLAIPNPGVKVYLSDYESELWNHIVSMEDTIVEKRDKMNYMDIWSDDHLPASPSSTQTRRIAFNRHRREGTNNQYLDGHVDWLQYTENTREKWMLRD